MKTELLAAVFAATLGFLGVRVDATYTKVGSITPNTQTPVTLSVETPTIKVSCLDDTYVGTGARLSDGGVGVLCSMTDGGLPCDLIRYTLGEKYHARLPTGHNQVNAWRADGGTLACHVFVAVN